ncbi:response regulator receiver domain protein [Mageeibacillus indolicus UPII9-5]|uniref:Stage 0 sporulation protein A homolog n=1 Tax=Mageeibacillus indolicus (strain UPII9-5) TaxID=699246 RepID=D3R2Z7_MAGIU|nr:response regulator [Mageeibacillus indolicus]ADC91110.1 response regulator receiver domain protein [Mageeibacillus indolicus UPII9-5]
MDQKILVVDDEINVVDLLKDNLEREGYHVITAFDGVTAYNSALSDKPDLILLDCMLPRMNGVDVCKKIRQSSSVPIIMITAKSEEVDKVIGLELGADDYITKPFSVREVLARVKATLRRMGFVDQEQAIISSTIEFGEFIIDLRSFELRRNGCVINLTLREFELISFLAQHPGEVFTREQLLERVWGYEYYGDVRTVDVTVRRTREKIEGDTQNNYKYILTRRGVGYYFENPGATE